MKIENVYLTINLSGKVSEKDCKDVQFENGVYEKDGASDGVYIVTDREKLILPEFWGLHKTCVTPVGVAVIGEGKRIFIDKQESDEELKMLSECESVGKEYGSSEAAIRDFDGKGNTESLAKKGSPAALYCTERGRHLPSLGEMKLANKHRELVDAALVMIGGMPFKCTWYWASTQYDSNYAWILYWSDGDVNNLYKNNKYRVRAFGNL